MKFPLHTRYEFEIWLSSDGGTITIPQYSLEASIFGQEIADITRFDGVIRVEEDYPIIDIGEVEESELSETVVAALHQGIPSIVADTYTPLAVGGEPETDFITDQNGDNILDQENEPIIGAEDILSPAIGVPNVTENVTITMKIDDSLVMRCGDEFYAGDDMSTGLYNTLI